MKRFISGLLAALLALMMLFSGALAAGESLIGLGMQINEEKEDDKTVGGDINLILYSAQGAFAKTVVTYEKDGETVEVDAKVNTWQNSGCATSHVYVVDVGAYVLGTGYRTPQYRSGHRLDDVKATLDKLISSLPSGDNAVIIPTNQKASDRFLTSDMNVLYSAAEALAFDEKAQNKLLSTLRDVSSFLDNASDVNERKIVYVFSTGYTEDLSKSRLAETFRKQNAAVYTIAYHPSDNTKKETPKNYETFQQLALNSAGGVTCFTPYNSDRNREISEEQLSSILNTISDNDANFFAVNFEPEEGMEDVSKFVLKQGSAATEFSVSKSERETIERMITGGGDSSWDAVWEFIEENWILCTVGAVLVVLIVVVLLIVFRRKEEDDESDDVSEDIDVNNLDGGETVGQTVGQTFGPLDVRGGGETMPVVAETLNVKVDRITQGDVQVTVKRMTVSDPILLGRNADTCQIVFGGKDSARISREHAKMQYHNGMMMIENKSGNGTKVNNEKINRPAVLQQNDLVTLGDVTVRISWSVSR